MALALGVTPFVRRDGYSWAIWGGTFASHHQIERDMDVKSRNWVRTLWPLSPRLAHSYFTWSAVENRRRRGGWKRSGMLVYKYLASGHFISFFSFSL